jgi:hypothetical protein
MAKATVAEWRAYLASPDWPEDHYFDDELIRVGERELTQDQDGDDNFLAELEQSAVITIETGVLYHNNDKSIEIDLAKHFNAWRKKQTHVVIAVQVKREDEATLVAIIKANGGSICR